MHKCSTCLSVSEPVSISTPRELSALIRQIKAAMEAHVLIEIEGSHGAYADPFFLVDAEGNWQDIINNTFACTACRQQYRLFANTYRGSKHNGWAAAQPLR